MSHVNCLHKLLNEFPPDVKAWVSSLTDSEIVKLINHIGHMPNVLHQPAEQTSAVIGLIGEKEVENILTKKYTVSNTAKKGKSGDLLVDTGGCLILVEVKKYTKSVPNTEIDKFYRDIEANASLAGGIMISLSSKIVGKTKTMELESYSTIHGKLPLIFISLKQGGCPESVIDSCIEMISYWSKHRSKIINVSDNISNAIDKINNNIDHLSQCRNLIYETQNIVNKQFSKLTQGIMAAEIQIKDSFNTLKSLCTVEDIEYKTLDLSSVLIEESHKNMIQTVIYKKNAIIHNNIIKCQNITFKLGKTGKVLKVSIETENMSKIPVGVWSYTNKILNMPLNDHNLNIVESLMCENDVKDIM